MNTRVLKCPDCHKRIDVSETERRFHCPQCNKSFVAIALPKFKRMYKAIKDLNNRSIYPSAAKINIELGRNGDSLNAQECEARREIFRLLSIEMK